jgi:hypothetical protein
MLGCTKRPAPAHKGMQGEGYVQSVDDALLDVEPGPKRSPEAPCQPRTREPRALSESIKADRQSLF